ncbi:MAG TPA: TasA family protein [Candidatus Paceibacterota bacterium]|nr:TasA family protein [Candidatus Paceibacterota bacterium]
MKWINYKKRIFRKTIKGLGKIGIFVGVICLAFYGISILGGTTAYFSDIEDSNTNTFSVGTLDFSLTGSDFSPSGLNPGDSSTKNLTIQNNGTLGFQYKINYEKVSGDLCNDLELTAGTYIGLLENFTDLGPFTFSSTPSWNFIVSLPSGASGDLQGEICNFKFVFNGWQEGLSEGQGFYDTEEIQSTISANYWSPPVVLNEFLPNPIGDDTQNGILGEWVEIYNQTSNPLDLAGWYIKNATDNQIIIQSTNTLDSSTTIGANGWLVVFMNDDILNNTGDTVDLYNSNDVLVDSYTYALPEYNINNTPGSTNDMVLYLPLNNDLLDQSGNNNDGINDGATFISGKISDGLSFDGNDNVTVADASSLNPSQITLEAWVKNSETPGAYKYIIDKHYSGSFASYAFYTGSSGGLRFYIGHSGGFVLSPAVGAGIWDNNWHHVVGTYDGSKVRLYVDGAEIGSGTATTVNITYNSNNFYLGSYGNGFYWKGLIDEIKIYDKALDFSEVVSHYGQIPENKSYARIPDGSSIWVDPIPTPGKPNILEEQIEIDNQEDLEVEFENIDNTGLDEFIVLESIEITEPTIIEEINEIVSKIAENIVQENIEESTVEEILPEQIIEETPEEILEDIELPTEPIIEIVEENTEEILATEEQITTEEPAIEQTPTIEEVPIIEETLITEEMPIQELITEPEPIIESVVEEPKVEELVTEEPMIEESILSE